MHFSRLLVPALSVTVLGAPTFPELDVEAAMPQDGLTTISEYFNLLARKVEANKAMASPPVCDMARAKLPIAPEPLPLPAEGLAVKHVAVGRGTQNYTCDVNNSTAPPKATGAVAVLFDASCVAATYPDLLDLLPRVALSFNLTDDDVLAGAHNGARLGPSNLAVSGVHFFNVDKEPFFNVTTDLKTVGEISVSKNASVPAPPDASIGQQGEPAVGWLRLLAKEATGGLREVFRVGTAGGSAPKTCEGMPENFVVEYAAQYWFLEGPELEDEQEEDL